MDGRCQPMPSSSRIRVWAGRPYNLRQSCEKQRQTRSGWSVVCARVEAEMKGTTAEWTAGLRFNRRFLCL